MVGYDVTIKVSADPKHICTSVELQDIIENLLLCNGGIKIKEIETAQSESLEKVVEKYTVTYFEADFKTRQRVFETLGEAAGFREQKKRGYCSPSLMQSTTKVYPNKTVTVEELI